MKKTISELLQYGSIRAINPRYSEELFDQVMTAIDTEYQDGHTLLEFRVEQSLPSNEETKPFLDMGGFCAYVPNEDALENFIEEFNQGLEDGWSSEDVETEASAEGEE